MTESSRRGGNSADAFGDKENQKVATVILNQPILFEVKYFKRPAGAYRQSLKPSAVVHLSEIQVFSSCVNYESIQTATIITSQDTPNPTPSAAHLLLSSLRPTPPTSASVGHTPPPLTPDFLRPREEEIPFVSNPSDLLVQTDEGFLFPVVDLIRRIYRHLPFEVPVSCETGRSQAPRRQQVANSGIRAKARILQYILLPELHRFQNFRIENKIESCISAARRRRTRRRQHARNSAHDTMHAGRAWWMAVASSLTQIVARWSGATPAAVRHAWRTGLAVIGAAMPHKMRPAAARYVGCGLRRAAAVWRVSGSVVMAIFF
ncbi:hypothetical protein F511_09237 [Dorcoceras hygrometricum]|uniref:Uncharacterized protein n=1 Tax=Dorcoceras hygrometricum TaxID=472368 RepID=A0A2Z7AGN1_9LAMI|nr:hypothetical protein F511_09237 [Dorcoceras hygrometricum]